MIRIETVGDRLKIKTFYGNPGSMKVFFFNVRDYEKAYLKSAAGKEMECVFFPGLLSIQTADEARNAI